jgi:regulatory subunit for Cdc7p protein kinase
MVMKKALEFGDKIWSVAKLESVLERCISPTERAAARVAHSTTTSANQPTLTTLLAAERRYGTTTERDPTQRRHDYRYFSKNSYFILVEDMHQELATIIAMEYPISKSRDGQERGSWPVLHCHPHARGPFVEYDEIERKRWEKQERAHARREHEREEEREQIRQIQERRRSLLAQRARQQGDLRRTVSMVNLQRQASGPDSVFQVACEGEADVLDSACPSGYLQSGAYVAASGNSVGITSTTGTTSTTGQSLHNLQLPPHLGKKIQQEVITARRFTVGTASGDARAGSTATEVMGPPAGLPERRNAMLKKSRSTNTLRLPKREEGSKPGYCESCRVKFDDFSKVGVVLPCSDNVN